MAGTMLAQQMLSFEKRHAIQPPSLTHAHELRASIGTKCRLTNETSFPERSRSRVSRGSPSHALPNRLPELSADVGSPSPTRSSPSKHTRRKTRAGTKKPRRDGKGARSLDKLDQMRHTGQLSDADYKKASAAVQATVGGDAATPSAKTEQELVARPDEEVEEELELGAEEVAAETRDILTPMTPSRHIRAQEAADIDVPEEEEGTKVGSDKDDISNSQMSLFGLYTNMPLLSALAKGGEGYRRPDTAEIIDDPDDLPPLTARMSSVEGFHVSSPKPSKIKRTLGKGALIAREAKLTVCPHDFVDDTGSDAASDVEDINVVSRGETQKDALVRERVRAAKQLARAPSRGEKFHNEALTVNNFGLIGSGIDRKLWWQKTENEAVTSEEVPEQLAIAPEANVPDWKREAVAGGPELFYGEKARQAFFDLTKSQQREWSTEGIPDENGEGGEPDSGRRHYLRECELTHKVPQPILVQHNNSKSKVIDLSYRRLGNTTGTAYAGALLKAAAQQGVELEELRLRENNLTTRGIVAIAATIHSCPDLRIVDLSANNFSEQASEALGKALQNHLRIQQITMSNCGIDDKDGGYLVAALSNNPSIIYLDLSRNQLGAGAGAWCRDAACPATLHPKSSATAKIGQMLQGSGTTHLHTLNLSYNSLGSKHVRLMATSLKRNESLQRLDLSWNTCGDEGAMALADALRSNKALLTLNLTRTGIGERGAMVIADVLKENQGLEEVKLDENPVGQRGGRAILRALRKILQYGWNRHITVTRANFQLVDESQKGTTRFIWVDDPTDTGEIGTTRKLLQLDSQQPLFDPADAGGHHKCELSDPYERMVAWELVELAWTEDGQNWTEELWNGDKFDLDEPESGEIWQRREHQVLPEVGLLELQYTNTPRVPRFKDVLEPQMLIRLLQLMAAKEVTDHGMALLQLATQEFWFTAEYASLLLKMQKDSESRVIAAAALYPRIVDIANVPYHILDYLTKSEARKLESHLGPELFFFMPSNPTGHYKLDLVNPNHRIIKQKLVEIAKEEKDFRRANRANQGGLMIDTSQHGDWENFRNETLNGAKYDFDTSTAASGSDDLRPPAILEFDYVSTSVAHRLLNLPPMTEEVFELFLLDLFRVRHYVDIAENVGKDKKPKKNDQAQSAEQVESDENLDATVSSGFLVGSEASLNATQELEYTEESQDLHPDADPEPEPEPTNEFANFGGAPQPNTNQKARNIKKKQAVDKFGEEDETSVELIQAIWRGKMVRRMNVAKKRAQAALRASQETLARLAQASQKVRDDPTREDDILTAAKAFISAGNKKPPRRKVRNCWWIPTQHERTVVMPEMNLETSMDRRRQMKSDRLHIIAKRQLLMLRRSTAQWYFSVAQCTKILEAIPAWHHVEAIVIMFSRITDIENLDVATLLGHKTFDKDGNGWITEEELAQLRHESSSEIATQRYLQACHRIGHANLFNPLFPEREYALNLRDFTELPPSDAHPEGDRKGHHDQRRVVECLMLLSAEPGDNTVNETYNGNYIQVEDRWTEGVPHVGMFCTTYNTRRHGGSLALRLPLCRGLLAPGKGRYKKTLALCPLNARALQVIGDDNKLQKRYQFAADCEDPREELISLIVHAEIVRAGNNADVINTEMKLRKELSLLKMNPIQHNARADEGSKAGATRSSKEGLHTTKTASFWKNEIFDETDVANAEEFDQPEPDWENEWTLDADGA